jgi:hypothetical protein
MAAMTQGGKNTRNRVSRETMIVVFGAMADPVPPKPAPPPAPRETDRREAALRAALPAARRQFRDLLAVLAGPKRG